MARVIKAPNVFLSLHLLVSEAVHDLAGSVHLVEFPQPISADWIPVRTILTHGSVRFEFPGTDSPGFDASAPGGVTPFVPQLLGKTVIQSTMLTDNVTVQCVTPQPGYRIEYRELDIANGALETVEKGSMLFIFGDSYLVNGKSYSSFEMFAVQYNDVTINALSACHLVIFTAVPKGV